MTLATNIAKVKSRIHAASAACNRNGNEPILLAVSKTHTVDAIKAAYALGLREFGENYLQEALAKIAATAALDINWHFIGPIQSNKTRDIANHFDWVHSVDRIKVATRLNEQRQGAPLNVCIQVNISAEPSKSGCTPTAISELAQHIAHCPQLQLRGLMAIPSRANSAAEFAQMQQLFIELQTHYPYIDTLSMGMSADLETAIAHGATMLRIGTDIFGVRNQAPSSH